MTENNRIEYKRELTDSLEKEVVAFLNYKDGGVIYIGIDKEGQVYGLVDCDRSQLAVKDRLKNNIQPSIMGLFDIVHEKRGNRDILRIIVAGGLEKPYYLKKYGMTERGCYLRIGSASEPMSQDMIDSLYGRRIRNTIGRMESPRQALSFEQLKIYYEARGLTLNHAFMKNLDMLTPEGKPNYAAYLLADDNGTSLQVAKYADATRVNLIENRDFGRCSLVKALKSILERMDVENTIFTRIGYPLREEREMIDSTAMREAVINAIVHNDYSYGATPKFEFFSDRLEITSMGGLPYGVDEEDFFSGFSVPRNKEIMRVLRDLEIVEHLGSGIPRILKAYGKKAFEIRKSFVRVILPYAKPFGKQEQTSAPPISNAGQVTGQVTGQVDPWVQGALLFCSEPRKSAEIQTVIGISHRETFQRNYLKRLLQEGLLEKTIPDKPNSRLQKYRLTEKGRALLNALNQEQ
jgi:ATP-dependent DNA helicase RecG